MHHYFLSKAYLPSIRTNHGILLTSIPIQALRARATIPHSRARHLGTVEYESKYAEKLRKRAEEKGLSVAALKANAKEKQEKHRRQQREFPQSPSPSTPESSQISVTGNASSSHPSPLTVRKDSSPVKPLSSILNIPRILATPHSHSQISALWTAYHVSRSGGTGRGYVCASIPLERYQKMAGVAEKYPSFVVPIPRVKYFASAQIEGEKKTAYEFYFLQWGFHGPPVPSSTEPNRVTSSILASNATQHSASKPQITTILFTPLQEFKQRASFATPYLVLTHYTDFAHTHGTVLLRGEITPSASATSRTGASETYLLNQTDAQLLSMGVQKFYLWGEGDGREGEQEGERLLKTFHDKPEEFKWEELLKHAAWSI